MCRKMLQSCVLVRCSCKKKKKSILLVFKHKRLTRIGGRGVDLCALAAPRSNVHLWQVVSAENTATERAVGFRSHYTICFSNLLLFSVDICSRGLCVCVLGVLFSRGRGGGCPRLPTSPRDPKANSNEILNDSKLSTPSKKFYSVGSFPTTQPHIGFGDNGPFVFAVS